jgi:hypothetical protein
VTAINAKINYVPLYIVDTQADVKVVKRAPAAPLFITQDDHKLILPDIEDSLTLVLLRNDQCVYQTSFQRSPSEVNLSATLVGDYEVRLCLDSCYYFGYLTLERQEKRDTADIPNETELWENITQLGSNTSQQAILDNIMGLHVVEYNMKPDSEQRRIGLLATELREVFPQVVYDLQGGQVGINYLDLVPVLFCCIQELKNQLDIRTERIADIMLSRYTGTSAAREIRAAIGNTLLSVTPTSAESVEVRFLLTEDVVNAHITLTDMGGRVITEVPVSPSDTSVTISSGTLAEGIYLCTLFANGQNVGTKRLVKAK